MSAIGSIDWAFLEFFLGDHGKITAAVIALLLAVISLLIATLKYLAARMATKERDDARKDRDFARSDEIRDRLTELGWEVMDTPEGTKVRPRG